MSDLQKQDLEFWKECYCIALKGLSQLTDPELFATSSRTQQAEVIADNSLTRLWKKRDELDNR